jgi:hypothetical protein
VPRAERKPVVQRRLPRGFADLAVSRRYVDRASR